MRSGRGCALNVVADGHQLLAVEDLIGFRVPVSGNRLTRKNQIYRALQLRDRTAGAIRLVESRDLRPIAGIVLVWTGRTVR
jgi:hypothetical protein